MVTQYYPISMGLTHRKGSIEDIRTDYLFTHVRGEIPPHVVRQK